MTYIYIYIKGYPTRKFKVNVSCETLVINLAIKKILKN